MYISRCRRNPRPGRAGFTLIELLVVIAIIAFLAAILFPVFSEARRKAHQAACVSNLRQIALGCMQYRQDFDGMYPYWNWNYFSSSGSKAPNQLGTLWFNAIYPYVKNADVYNCPVARDKHTLRESKVWSWTNQFDMAGIVTALQDKPVTYGFSEPLSTGATCEQDGPCHEGGLDRPAESLMFADCLQGLTNDLGGRPRRTDPTDKRHQFIITRVAYANGPPTCYEDTEVENCGGSQAGTIADFGARAARYDQQTRHANGSSLCFADGHAKWLPARLITYDLFAGDSH